MSIDTSENQSSNPSAKDVSSHLSSLIDARLTRRGVLGGLAGAYGLAVAACQSQSETDVDGPFDSAFNFKEISRGMDELITFQTVTRQIFYCAGAIRSLTIVLNLIPMRKPLRPSESNLGIIMILSVLSLCRRGGGLSLIHI